MFDYTKQYFQGIYIGTVPLILIGSLSPLMALDGKSRWVTIATLVSVGGETDLDGLKEVVKLAVRWICITVIPLAVLLAVLAPQVAACYINPSEAAFPLTVRLLTIYFISLPVASLNYVASSILQVTGRRRGAFLFNMANEFAGLVLCVIIMGNLYGIRGAFLAFLVWQVILLGIYVIIGLLRKCTVRDAFAGLLYLDDEFCRKNAHIYTAKIHTVEEFAGHAAKVQQFCIQNGIPESQAMKLALCMEEFADNVVKHGFEPGKDNALEIRVSIDGRKMLLHLRDNCRRFNFTEYVQTRRTAALQPEAGIGIRMVVRMAEEIRYANTLNVNNLIVQL